jgi:peptide/nickel transport system permease protein
MINEGTQYVDKAGWIILFPGMAITLTVLSLQIVGDGLRDALDPRLARGL